MASFFMMLLRRQQALVLLGPLLPPFCTVQPADRLFLLATLHAYVVFSLAGFPSIVFHAGLLLFPTLLTAIRLLSLCCGSDAAQTEQNEDNRSGSFHDDLLSMVATTSCTSCLWFASRSLALLLAVRSKLLEVGPYLIITHVGCSSGNAMRPITAVIAMRMGLFTFQRKRAASDATAMRTVSQSPIAICPSRT